MKYNSKKSLDYHNKRKHTEDNNTFSCEQCEKTFDFESRLKQHRIISHERLKTKCSFCSKMISAVHLNQHIRKIHENERNFKCHVCPKAFFNQWGLTNHVNGVHLNIRNYECTMCGDKFKKSIHLKTHIKLKHKMDLTHKEVLELTSQKPKNE